MNSPRPSTPRQWVVMIVALLAVIAIVFAGFKLVFGGDDTAERQELTDAVETYQATRSTHADLLAQEPSDTDEERYLHEMVWDYGSRNSMLILHM